MTRREVIALATAVLLGLLAWGGGSVVNLFQRVSTVEADQRNVVRWMESIDERLSRIEDAVRRR